MTFPIKNGKMKKVIQELRKNDARKDFGNRWSRFYRNSHGY